MLKSEEIRNRLIKADKRFYSNDNISDYLLKGDLEELVFDAELAFIHVLEALVIDIKNDPNAMDTAKRLAKMYVYELFEGRYNDVPKVTAFDNSDEHAYDGMLVVRAEITSVCAHHHQQMKGVCYIGIIPNGQVMGLSKYVRLAQWVARRGQIQEQLTNQISKAIMDATGSADVGVYLALSHGCCENRGVRAHSSLTQTTVLSGKFKTDPSVKEEFYHNVRLQENFTDSR